MIEMIRSDVISFHIQMGILDVEKLLKHIDKIKSKNRINLQIRYLGIYRQLEIELNENVDELQINKSFVRLYMDDDEIDYFAQRLKAALISRCFYPPEICEKYYKKRHITIYCDVI